MWLHKPQGISRHSCAPFTMQSPLSTTLYKPGQPKTVWVNPHTGACDKGLHQMQIFSTLYTNHFVKVVSPSQHPLE